MKERENFFIVHEQVSPVKIGVMNNEHEREGHDKIKPSMLTDFSIIFGVRRNCRILQNQDGHSSKNANGNN
jgi:hypothetical protein